MLVSLITLLIGLIECLIVNGFVSLIHAIWHIGSYCWSYLDIEKIHPQLLIIGDYIFGY